MSSVVVEAEARGRAGAGALPAEAEPPATRLGGHALITMGALYIILLGYSVVTPSEQRYGAGAFLRYFSEDRVPLTVAWSMLCLTSILGFVFVPAVYDLLKRHVHGRDMRELFRAATVYGLIGYAFLAVSFLTLVARAPGMARAHANGSPATREAMEAFGRPELDPNGWIVFGGVAIWVIVSTVIALRTGLINKVVAGFGFLWGIGFWATVFAYGEEQSTRLTLSSPGGSGPGRTPREPASDAQPDQTDRHRPRFHRLSADLRLRVRGAPRTA